MLEQLPAVTQLDDTPNSDGLLILFSVANAYMVLVIWGDHVAAMTPNAAGLRLGHYNI